MTMQRSVGLAFLVAVACTGVLRAQQTRNQRIAAAFAAYDNFQSGQALELLQRAVNPSEGPQDDEWFRAVQLMAEILIADDKQADASTWLRWAFRLSPRAQIDEVNRAPEVVTAARAAQGATAGGSPGDSVTRTTWQWVAPGAGNDRGMLRIESPGMAAPVRALVQGSLIESGRTLTLSPGTYEIQAAAEGYLTAQVRRDVLPGVTTVLSFNLTPVGAPAVAPPVVVAPPPRIAPPAPVTPTLSEATRLSVQRQMSPITVSRFGAGAACGTAAFVGRSGLLLTSYQTIRGAERVEIEQAGGRRLSDEVRVAAYDVGADLAVLQIPTIRGDSLTVAASVAAGPAWGFGYSSCTTPRDAEVNVATVGAADVGLADSLGTGIGPLLNATGAIVGYATGGRSAASASRVSQVVEQARRNSATGAVLTVGQVALRENHAFGSVAITSDLTGADIQITPLEAWQWAGTGASGTLPLTFRGPMGRYRLQLRVAGQTRREMEFTIRPALADRLNVAVQQVAQVPPPVTAQPQVKKGGGGGGIVLAILGIGAAGAGVYLLAGKKDNGGGNGTTPTTDPGSISVTVPNPSVLGTILGILRGR
jgi:hypothetical protein